MPDQTPIVRILLYFGFLFLFLFSFRFWLLDWLLNGFYEQIVVKVMVIFILIGVLVCTWLLYGMWLIERSQNQKERERAGWFDRADKVIIFALTAIWIPVLVVVHVIAVQVLFGVKIVEPRSQQMQQPGGFGVAAFGVIMLLVSFPYFISLVRRKDSYFAERSLDFMLFMLWFLCGFFLLILSNVLDPIIGAASGDLILERLDVGDDPKHSLIVVVPAIVLAAVVELWHRSRRY